MDITYHSICRLRDIREENLSSGIYNSTKSTDSLRQVPLPPPDKILSAGEELKRGTVPPRIMTGGDNMAKNFGAVPKILMKMKKEKNVGKKIKNKIEKGGDKENQSSEIYENEGILKRKSIP